MPTSSVSKKLEKAFGEKFPGNLDKIIEKSGYDCETVLLTINSNSINEIESYINANKEYLRGTAYEYCISTNSVFKLKPGHRALILSIPKKLSTKKKKCAPTVLEGKENDNFDDERVCENEAQLKDAIVHKLVKFASDRNFNLNLNKSDIFDFRMENDKLKCDLQCPICHKRIKCEYKSYWLVSNFQKHLKVHFSRDVVIVDYSREHSLDIDHILDD